MSVLSACKRVCASLCMSGCRLQRAIQPCWAICSPPVCLRPLMGIAEEEAKKNGRDDVFPFWPSFLWGSDLVSVALDSVDGILTEARAMGRLKIDEH